MTVAAHLAPFIEQDGCLDAGGVFNADTGICALADMAEYVSVFARPGLYMFWLVFTGAVFFPAWAAFALVAQRLSQTGRSG